jgi:hypothetical protein
MANEIIPFPHLWRYKRRLLALADHIETVPQNLFNMKIFRETGKGHLADCGTVGCLLGHAPSLLIKRFRVKSSELVIDNLIDWNKVSLKLCGITTSPYNNNRALWDYLFSSRWGFTDNTSTGAAKRIRWVVEHSGIPVDYVSQIYGDTPLSYEQGENNVPA